MEFVLRDTRHLKGTTPKVQAATPETPGLAVDAGRDAAGAYLTVRDDTGRVWTLDLAERLNVVVEEARLCVGRHTEDGLVACPHGAHADHFDRCPACHFLPDRECVFNPRCTNCTLDFCRGSHKLYLAFYGELPKVGMTRAARGDDRLVEQGADAFAIIAHAADRADARRLEDLVTRRLGIPQARRAEELLSRTARDVPWTAIQNAYHRLVPRLGDLLGTAPGPLERITDETGAFPFPVVPTLAGTVGHHAGRVVGVKGKYLFYVVEGTGEENDGPIWALNLPAVVTHRVRFDPDDARASGSRATR